MSRCIDLLPAGFDALLHVGIADCIGHDQVDTRGQAEAQIVQERKVGLLIVAMGQGANNSLTTARRGGRSVATVRQTRARFTLR